MYTQACFQETHLRMEDSEMIRTIMYFFIAGKEGEGVGVLIAFDNNFN